MAVLAGTHDGENYGGVIVLYCKKPQQDQTEKEKMSFVAPLTSPPWNILSAKVPVAVTAQSICVSPQIIMSWWWPESISLTLRAIPFLSRMRWQNETQWSPTSFWPLQVFLNCSEVSITLLHLPPLKGVISIWANPTAVSLTVWLLLTLLKSTHKPNPPNP